MLGWPVNMDGSTGPRCDSVRDFAHAFLKLREIPIAFQDERMSTKAVESAMVAADLTRAKRAATPGCPRRLLDFAIGTRCGE